MVDQIIRLPLGRTNLFYSTFASKMKFLNVFIVFLSLAVFVSGQFFGGTQFYQAGQYQAAGFSPFPIAGHPFAVGAGPFIGGGGFGGGHGHSHVHYHDHHGHSHGFGGGLIPGGINSRDVGSGKSVYLFLEMLNISSCSRSLHESEFGKARSQEQLDLSTLK